MKSVMTLLVGLGLTLAVSAQHGRVIVGSRVVIASPGIGFGFGYPYYYAPFGYPFGYPYGYNNGYGSSSKLQMKIEDIKNDYKDKIWSAKQDKSLSKDERKNTIHQLKVERDKAINDLKLNYYKQPRQAPETTNKG